MPLTLTSMRSQIEQQSCVCPCVRQRLSSLRPGCMLHLSAGLMYKYISWQNVLTLAAKAQRHKRHQPGMLKYSSCSCLYSAEP